MLKSSLLKMGVLVAAFGVGVFGASLVASSAAFPICEGSELAIVQHTLTNGTPFEGSDVEFISFDLARRGYSGPFDNAIVEQRPHEERGNLITVKVGDVTAGAFVVEDVGNGKAVTTKIVCLDPAGNAASPGFQSIADRAFAPRDVEPGDVPGMITDEEMSNEG